MDINLLNTFLEVSKTQHFREAAENLYLTQSAVSSRIKGLESQLDVKLFDRSTKLVRLTTEGQRFIKHAETMVLAWGNAKLDLNTAPVTVPQISIGTTTGLWQYIFNDKVGAVLNEQDIYINALSLSGKDLHHYLNTKLIDLALVYSPENQPGLTVTPLGVLELKLILPVELAGEQTLDTLPYIHVDWGENFNQYVSRKLAHQQQRIMQTDNAQTAHSLLSVLQACAYLPKVILETEHQFSSMHTSVAPVFKRKVYACYLESNENRPKIKRLISLLKL